MTTQFMSGIVIDGTGSAGRTPDAPLDQGRISTVDSRGSTTRVGHGDVVDFNGLTMDLH
jgi:hypothetical protein